ncbi:hypothetical protein ScPMuIL_013117 [Solemya velum]
MGEFQRDSLVFFVNGKKVVEENPDPALSLLHFLRRKLHLPGTKEACGQGGCGACTVMLSQWDTHQKKALHISANACLVPVCWLHGMAVTTVEGVGSVRRELHPIQSHLVANNGLQCGFCTPGMVMSMYTLTRNNNQPTLSQIEGCIEGNLCRCTGYRPILDAFKNYIKSECPYGDDCCQKKSQKTNEKQDEKAASVKSLCLPDNVTQDPIFPPELQLSDELQRECVKFQAGKKIWYRPTTLSELLDMKALHPEATLVMGNTIAGYMMKTGKLCSDIIIHGTHVDRLGVVELTENGLLIGSALTLTRMEEVLQDALKKTPDAKSRYFVALIEMVRQIGSTQIRNVATLGGNIINAAPNHDLNPLLLSIGVKVHIASKAKGELCQEMTQAFFCGFRKTALEPDEVLVAVTVPYSSQEDYIYGFKQCERNGFDMAVVNTGMVVRFHGDSVGKMTLCYGGVGATVIKAEDAGKAALGLKWDEQMLTVVCDRLMEEVKPKDPTSSLVQYKLALVSSLFLKFYLTVSHARNQEGAGELADLCPHKPCDSMQVFEAVDPNQHSHDEVGHPRPNVSGPQITTGEALFIDDMPRLENELFMSFVMSTKSHARLVSIDASAALALPGVVDFVSHEDIPGNKKWGIIIQDDDVFAEGKVTCYGQIIGGILAESREIAKKAVSMVKVEYEELEPILTIKDAIQKQSFYDGRVEINFGDVTSETKISDHVIEGEVLIGGQEHFYLETFCVLAIPKQENDEMELFCSTQNLSFIQSSVAAILGVDRNRIVCKAKRVGGAFGGKELRSVMVCGPAAVAAVKTGRAVRVVLDRYEDMSITGRRHQVLAEYKVGFTKTGKFKFLDLHMYCNAGNTLDVSACVMEESILHLDNSYKIPNAHVIGDCCRTNIASNTAFRAFGGPQTMVIMETIITEMADTLGCTPEQIREVNFIENGTLSLSNQLYTDVQIQECWKECLQKSQFNEKRQQVLAFNEKNHWVKRGISAIPMKYGIGYYYLPLNQGGALIHIYTDGSVLIAHGGVELGQGLYTKMIQVASRALGVPSSKIFTSETSTNTVPNTTATAASTASDINGFAIINACEILRARLKPYMEADPNGTWEKWVSAAYMDCVSLSATGFYRTKGYDSKTNSGEARDYYTYGTICTEIEIDTLTGDHQVLSAEIVMDVGKSLNPAIDIGQIEGGFIQGYGMMTTEELSMSTDGRPLNLGPSTYKLPTVRNIPQKFNVSLLKDSKCERAVYSSKGIGEPPYLLAASVIMAIREAVRAARADNGLTGFFRFDCPATAERIRLACQDKYVKDLKIETGKDTVIKI